MSYRLQLGFYRPDAHGRVELETATVQRSKLDSAIQKYERKGWDLVKRYGEKNGPGFYAWILWQDEEQQKDDTWRFLVAFEWRPWGVLRIHTDETTRRP